MQTNARVSHVLVCSALAVMVLGVPLASAACGQGPTRDSFNVIPDAGTSAVHDSGATHNGGDAGGTGLDDSGNVAIDGGGSPGQSWAGSYSCTVSDNVMITAPLSTSAAQTAPASMVVTENGSAVAAAFTSDGGFMCSLTFQSNGSTASLSPATTQSCEFNTMSQVGPIPTKVTFSSGGTATRNGSSVKADNLAITVSDGTGGNFGLKGSGTMSADCTHE